jgi:hypothetical protein
MFDVRLLDIFFIGPFKIYISTLTTAPYWARVLLFLSGLGIVLYNGATYCELPGVLPLSDIFFQKGYNNCKSDFMRYADIFIIGPFFMWYSTLISQSHKTSAIILLLIGISTIIYNAKNLATGVCAKIDN